MNTPTDEWSGIMHEQCCRFVGGGLGDGNASFRSAVQVT